MLKVVIADDHRLILAGIKRALEDDGEFEVVGEASTGEPGPAARRATSPDVVVLDIRMPGMDGLVCLDQIKKRHPDDQGDRALGLDRPEADRERPQARRERLHRQERQPGRPAGRSRQAIDETVYTAIGLPDDTSAGAAKAAGLTDRELAILAALARGLSNEQIAKELWVAPQTVKFHLTNIYRKLGRREPHRGGALRLPAGPRREPAVRARIARSALRR